MKPDLKIKRDNNGNVTARLSGELTVRYGNEMAGFFQKIKDEEGMVLRIENPVGLDLSFLQLFWSYCQHVKKQGRKITVSCMLNEADAQLLHRTGFAHLLSLNNSQGS